MFLGNRWTDMVGVCSLHLKPISTQLRQDQLQRGEARSHKRSVCLAEVTGSPGEWREPWWLSSLCIRNVLWFPLNCRHTWLAPTEDIMGERFFHWMWVKRKSKGFSKEVINSWIKPSVRKKGQTEKRGCMTLEIKMGGWEGVRGSVGEGTEREWLAFMDCRCGAVGFWQGPCVPESFTGWVAPRWGGGHRTATRSS